MKGVQRAFFAILLLLSQTVSAVEIAVGGRTIEIPVPEGYAALTPEMSPLYEMMFSYVVPSNERYLILIPNAVADAARRGEDVDYERYMIVEAERHTAQADLSRAQFADFRNLLRDQLDDSYEAVRQSLPDIAEDASDAASDFSESELELSFGDIVYYGVHRNSDNVLAVSQLMSIGVTVDGEETGDELGIATAAFVLVREKLIFAYVYGAKDDLEWSREFSANWVDQIVAANSADGGAALLPTHEPPYDADSLTEPSRDSLRPAAIAALVIVLLIVAGVIAGRFRRKTES